MSFQNFMVGALAAGLWGVGVTSGQSYPNKPIRILTTEPGGGVDIAARIIALGVTGSLGQPVIVVNRGGGGGAIAIETVAKAQPDGYTLLLQGSTIWLMPFLREHVSYDPVKDLSPVTLAVIAPLIVVVHPEVPANSIKELIALAKARPGALNYGAGAVGSQTHLAPELFKAMTGVNFVRVGFKGSGIALNALLAGELQLMFIPAGGVAPHLKSGKLRALAVTGSQPSALAPDLPTVAAAGVPGYESVSMVTIFAPAKTPTALINRLNAELVRFLHTAEAKERFLSSGVETVGSSPKELADTMKSEMTRLGKVIKDAGIREE